MALASALAAAPDAEDAVVVEIGTLRGLTACFIGRTLQLLGRAQRVLSIDPFGLIGKELDNYAEYQGGVRRYGLERTCMVLTAFSHAAVGLVPDRIALLVVDGDHTYDGVIGDLRLFVPKVMRGGVVFIDDCSPAYPGVARAADEFLGSTDELEILHRTRNVVARRVKPAPAHP